MELSNLVKGIIAHAQGGGITIPTAHQPGWHVLFYELKGINHPGKPIFLKDLKFDWDGPTPKAKDIVECISHLQGIYFRSTLDVHSGLVIPCETIAVWNSESQDYSPPERQYVQFAGQKARAHFSQL